MSLAIPERMLPFTKPFGSYRFRCVEGGRLSGKSTITVQCFIQQCLDQRLRAAVFRATEKSALSTIYECFIERLEAMGVLQDTKVLSDEFVLPNGSRITIHGIGQGAQTQRLKSLHGIQLCLIEEGQELVEDQWLILEPTIRGRSEIWVIWNTGPCFVQKEFVEDAPPDRSVVVSLHWFHNRQGIGPENVAKIEGEYRRNPARAAHQYEGQPYLESELKVFGNLHEARFELPQGAELRAGLDFGYSAPMAAVICHVREGRDENGPFKDLYCRHEIYRRGVHDHASTLTENRLFRGLDIWADSEDPGSCDRLVEAGYRAHKTPKPPGSVPKGLKYLEGFRAIYVHEDCPNVLREMKNFRRAKDARGEVTDTYAPKQPDHGLDALRYSLGDLIGTRKRVGKFFTYRPSDKVQDTVQQIPVEIIWSASHDRMPAAEETPEQRERRQLDEATAHVRNGGMVETLVRDDACGIPRGTRVVVLRAGEDALGQPVFEVARTKHGTADRRSLFVAYEDEILLGGTVPIDRHCRPSMANPHAYHEAFRRALDVRPPGTQERGTLVVDAGLDDEGPDDWEAFELEEGT